MLILHSLLNFISPINFCLFLYFSGGGLVYFQLFYNYSNTAVLINLGFVTFAVIFKVMIFFSLSFSLFSLILPLFEKCLLG